MSQELFWELVTQEAHQKGINLTPMSFFSTMSRKGAGSSFSFHDHGSQSLGAWMSVFSIPIHVCSLLLQVGQELALPWAFDRRSHLSAVASPRQLPRGAL